MYTFYPQNVYNYSLSVKIVLIKVFKIGKWEKYRCIHDSTEFMCNNCYRPKPHLVVTEVIIRDFLGAMGGQRRREWYW
jgi:hypothetical protein